MTPNTLTGVLHLLRRHRIASTHDHYRHLRRVLRGVRADCYDPATGGAQVLHERPLQQPRHLLFGDARHGIGATARDDCSPVPE